MDTIIRPPTAESLEEAAALLKAGEAVAIPTETVYGLAANALNIRAVDEIFAAKGRPRDNPLIVHVNGLGEARSLNLEVPPIAKKLEKFLPGPLTMLFNRTGGDVIPREVSCGLDTVAVRVPAHPVTREIIRLCGFPLAAPSANASGGPSPTSAKHVYDDLNGKIALIIDGGECEIGLESTVIAFEGNKIRLLRPGAVTAEQLREFADVIVDGAVLARHSGKAASPGMSHRHYAPKADVIACKGAVPAKARFVIAEPDAVSLFAKLRELDRIGARRVFVKLPEPVGIGLALYNRIIRAADFNVFKGRDVIGLTGMSGAGKSAASAIFEKRGFYVVNCDKFAKTVILKRDCQEAIREAFPEMFDEDVFSAKKAASVIFSDKNKLAAYENIVYPRILRALIALINEADEKTVVLDAPTLYQAGVDELCRAVVAVVADTVLCAERIIKRDGISEGDALKRLANQPSADFFMKKADYIIENSGSFEEFAQKTDEVADDIK